MRVRNESPTSFEDPEGPLLHNRHLQLESYIGVGNDLTEALLVALEYVIAMTLAA